MGTFKQASISLLLAWGFAQTVWALPPDQSLAYHIREQPTLGSSSVVFTIHVELEAVAQNGNDVTWEFTDVQFEQILESESVSWTPDPLDFDDWVITHQDPQDPKLDEFTDVPLYEGVAEADDPLVRDLEYAFEGQAYSGPPGFGEGSASTLLTYEFVLENDEEPEEEGEDEPVEVHPDDDA